MSTPIIIESDKYITKNLFSDRMYNDTGGDAMRCMHVSGLNVRTCDNCRELVFGETRCPHCGYSHLDEDVECSTLFSAIDKARMAYIKTMAAATPDLALAA